MQSKLPLLPSGPGGVRKSTVHGPWQKQTCRTPRRGSRINGDTRIKMRKAESGKRKRLCNKETGGNGTFRQRGLPSWRNWATDGHRSTQIRNTHCGNSTGDGGGNGEHVSCTRESRQLRIKWRAVCRRAA